MPLQLRYHGRIELGVFIIELVLLVTSYLTAVLRGPGFVPPSWAPSAEELNSRVCPREERPLDVIPPLRDCLQYCARCESFKPPRAHHCSTCGRCVLWMDHHCPWTGTCVGHKNLQAFVLFVHYAPLACLHSFIIHTELPIHLGMRLYGAISQRRFLQHLSQIQTISGLICWIVALIVMCLVGTLAWDMHWSISSNMTMVEEMVVDRADVRRSAHLENDFSFPYDLGKKKNREQILGHSWFTWLLPLGSHSDGFWPALREGGGHLDLSTEQLAQKAHKLSKTFVIHATDSFRGWRWLKCCCCCCAHWWCLLVRFGCSAACSGPPCGEAQMSIEPGQKLLMSQDDGDWLFVHKFETRLEGRGGWVPRACVARHPAKRYDVPLQKHLQGLWQTEAGKRVRVSGVLVHVVESRIPFVLRSLDEGVTASLLECTLKDCDGTSARWSNGDVWQRPKDADFPQDGTPSCVESDELHEEKKDVHEEKKDI